MTLPRFLVITPAYNPSKDYLLQCISSVSSQVSDNYSITHAVIFNGHEKYMSNWLRSLFIDSDNYHLKLVDIAPIKGVSIARNTALQSFSFDFCAFLDSDDIWQPGYLQKLFQYYTSDPSLDAISCKSLKLIGEQKTRLTGLPYLRQKILLFHDIAYNCIGCPSGFSFRFHQGHPLFVPQLSLCEDYLFYLDLYFNGYIRILRVNTPCYYYRSHPSQTTVKAINKWLDHRELLHSNLATIFKKYRVSWLKRFLVWNLVIGRLDRNNRQFFSLPFIFMCLYPPFLYGNISRLLENRKHE